MAFINPKIDFAFKKIFGSDGSQDIPIGFLNAIIYGADRTSIAPLVQLAILLPIAPGTSGDRTFPGLWYVGRSHFLLGTTGDRTFSRQASKHHGINNRPTPR